MSRSSFEAIRLMLTALCAMAVSGSTPCRANVKGGSLEGISPYGSWEKVDAARVKAEQRKSNQLREVRCDALPNLRFVTGFAQIREDGTRASLSPFLAGWTGAKRTKLPLSQIAGLTVKAKDAAARRVQCEIIVFPNVSPESLVQSQPNFENLAANHTLTSVVWISDGAAKPGRMAIVGRRGLDPASPEIRVAFDDIPVGASLRFHGPEILRPANYWWAIGSVSHDPKYPYHWPPTGE